MLVVLRADKTQSVIVVVVVVVVVAVVVVVKMRTSPNKIAKHQAVLVAVLRALPQ